MLGEKELEGRFFFYYYLDMRTGHWKIIRKIKKKIFSPV